MPVCSPGLKEGLWAVNCSDWFGRYSGVHSDRKLNRYDLFARWAQLHEACHAEADTHPHRHSEYSVPSLPSTATLRLPCLSTMTDKSKQPKNRDGVILLLDAAIDLVNIGKEAASMTPAPAVFGIATIILTTIKVSPTPCREQDVPSSNIARTRWPMIRIAWTLGYTVPTSVMRLSGEQAERRKTNSVSLCATR